MHLRKSPNLKNLFWGALTTVVIASSFSSDTSENKTDGQNKEIFPKELVGKDNIIKAFKDGRAASFGDFLKISTDFDSDTIKIDKNNARQRICLGQYMPISDKVEIKFFVTDYTDATAQDSAKIKRFEEFNMEQYVNGVKVHELCHLTFHRDGKIKVVYFNKGFDFDRKKNLTQIPFKPEPNAGLVIRVGSQSLEDVAIVGQYNEIGAETGRRIYERERYLVSRNIKEFFAKDKYVEAIEKGQVNPFDTTMVARKKEYALLARAVFERWLTKEKHNYAHTSVKDVQRYIRRSQEQEFLIPEASLETDMRARISSCFTFPIDGKLQDFSAFVKDIPMSAQPLVQKEIQHYHANNRIYKNKDKPQFNSPVPQYFVRHRFSR